MQYTEINVDQGADFSEILTLTDDQTGGILNITGYMVFSNVRTSYISPNVAFPLVCTINDAPNGNVSISLSAANTALYDARRYVFDVKVVTPSNTRSTLIGGILEIFPST